MKQLSKIQTAIFALGGFLMVVGAAAFAFYRPGFLNVIGDGSQIVRVTSWLFLLGTVLFSVIQAMQVYEGKSLVIHRLKKIQNVANILFVLSGISMVDSVYTFACRWFENPQTYYTLFMGKWIELMLIAAVLELYTTHRISRELKKEIMPKNTK